MSHKVYYGNFTLYGAEKVEVRLARPVTVHDGIGFGEFPVADSRKLREWTIKGQWTEKNDYHLAGWEPAHELIAGLKRMMGSDDPERLVMTNGYDKTSALAYVTDVTASETSAGVYDVTVKLTEYRKPAVRTTGVPAITRPGKIPEMPKTVVFNKSSDVGEDAVKRNNAAAQQGKPPPAINYCWTDEKGIMHQTNNPNIVPAKKPVTVFPSSDYEPGMTKTDLANARNEMARGNDKTRAQTDHQTQVNNKRKDETFSAMSDAIKKFLFGDKV